MPVDYLKIPSPCYVIDEKLLRRNLSLIKSIKDKSGIEIIPAFKGFSMWKVFPIICEYFSGAAASSVWEARLAAEEMKSLAHTYSPAFTEEDFVEVLKYSSHITFNSLSQFEKFFPWVRKFNPDISVGLRVNPEFSEVKTPLYNPCAPGTRLGITVDQLGDRLPEGVEGLHFHTLCESDSTDLEKTLAVFEEKFGKYLTQVSWLNMGGGHLMTRKDYDINLLINLLKDFRERWQDITPILEPGSAFVWETGVLVSTVTDIFISKGISTAILNVSFTAHMPDCLEMPYKPRILGAYHDPIPGKPTYRMGGNSCLAGDYIGDWSFDKELQPGDLIVFEDMIHYTMVKTTMFNGVPHPSIGLWNDIEGFRLLRKFSFEDYKNRMA